MSFRNIRDEGIQKVASAAERLLLLPPDGTVVEQLDTHTLYIYDQTTNTWTAVGSGSSSNAFGIIQTPAGTAPTADIPSDTVTFTSADGSVVITGDAITDTVDFAVSGTASVGSLKTEVYNNSGATITKGSVIYISGALGNLPTIALAKADSEVTSARTYGLVVADISNMSSGFVIHSGLIKNLNTFGVPEGVTLYLSPTTAGAYTTTKPLAPDNLVYVGTCTRAHPTMGTIEVTIQNGYELYELHDVSVPSFPSAPLDKSVLEYNAATSLWVDGSPKVKYPTAVAYALIFG